MGQPSAIAWITDPADHVEPLPRGAEMPERLQTLKETAEYLRLTPGASTHIALSR